MDKAAFNEMVKNIHNSIRSNGLYGALLMEWHRQHAIAGNVVFPTPFRIYAAPKEKPELRLSTSERRMGYSYGRVQESNVIRTGRRPDYDDGDCCDEESPATSEGEVPSLGGVSDETEIGVRTFLGMVDEIKWFGDHVDIMEKIRRHCVAEDADIISFGSEVVAFIGQETSVLISHSKYRGDADGLYVSWLRAVPYDRLVSMMEEEVEFIDLPEGYSFKLEDVIQKDDEDERTILQTEQLPDERGGTRPRLRLPLAHVRGGRALR